MFESYNQKLIFFLHFVDVFMSYSAWFCSSSAIYNGHSTRYIFEGMTKNSSFSYFIVVFMCYCSHYWHSKALYMFASCDQKLVVFAFYGRFHVLFSTVLRFLGDLQRP